ncbi:DUF4149 domain-containing protein [Roseococcus sp. YIM B11640]|uniref:DUF4149 domain-containing protein n=1 Tax=Roseococcus sp. YIM B11640 TaxID=3133973 RepID=UPI003C7D524D
MQAALAVIALYALALMLGGMVFFAAVTTPVAFHRLEKEQARHYIRGLFPIYYLWVLGASALSGVALLLLGRPVGGIAMLACALLTLWLRQSLLFQIRAADEAGDEPRFKRLHRISVIANLAQMLAAAAALAVFAA